MKYTILLVSILIFSCRPASEYQEEQFETQPEENPPAEGFNLDGSDSEAIAIADQVMEAMGGRSNWDETRYLSWNFFGRRYHTWDRYEGRDSIYIPDLELVIDMNVFDNSGTVVKNGLAMDHPDSLSKYLEYGNKLWVNDSYWLVMPFKLKDSGVTLKYLGLDQSTEQETCYKLQLTFSEVGFTPQNKYEVLVDTATNLVSEWSYFPNFEMDSATIITPWTDYKPHGNILLSGQRGKYALTEIKVLSDWK